MMHTLRAEMVATVHSVYIAEGEAVDADTMLVLLESMKMEIPVLAEVRGVASVVAVAPGDTIQEGDTIAIIDTAPASK